MSAPRLPAPAHSRLTHSSQRRLPGSPRESRRLGDRRPWESSFLSQDFSSCFSFRPQPGRGLCQQVTLETQGSEPWPCPGPTRGCPSLSLPPAPHCGSSLQPSPPSSGPACDPGPPGHTSNLNPQGGAPRPAASAPPGSSEKQVHPRLTVWEKPSLSFLWSHTPSTSDHRCVGVCPQRPSVRPQLGGGGVL